MRVGGFTSTIALTGLAALAALPPAPASAQALGDNLSPLQIAVACAPPPVQTVERPDAIRVLGAQASPVKSLLGHTDRIVLSGGSARGLAVGQEYFLRRLAIDPSIPGKNHPWPTITSGWITIAAVNETTAIAAVGNACGQIQSGDFIEPFERPNPPANVEVVNTTGQLDFGTLGHVVYGDEEHHNATVGDYLLIDQGADHGVTPGAYVALYRDPGEKGVPLVAVAEAAVVSVGPTLSLVRVNQAAGEVRTGDYVVPRR